jgi:SAM-dependent methyltransferase
VAAEGGFAGAVLDAGCGTGENALHIASLGRPVLGFDVAETALAVARNKAADRGLEVEFVKADALSLEGLGRRFATVLDCGLFHTFDADERSRYVASLASVTEPGGTAYVLCFRTGVPEPGPHPVSRDELRAAFTPGDGWHIAAVEPDNIHTRFADDGVPAWLATINSCTSTRDRLRSCATESCVISPIGVTWSTAASSVRSTLTHHPRSSSR